LTQTFAAPQPPALRRQPLRRGPIDPRPHRFVLLEQVGFGGMGFVFRGWDRARRQFVAIKVARTGDVGTAERLFAEARLLASLSHPGIRTALEAGWLQRRPYLVLEWVEGESLKSAARHLDLGAKLIVFERLVAQVAHCHARGVLHRDLKPSNVLLPRLRPLEPVLIDFGIARDLGSPGMTAAGLVLGTPGYLAPELLEGKAADVRTDVWALGALLHELVGGEPPFGEGPPREVLRRLLLDEPPPPPATLPPALAELLGRCLAREPSDRPACASELATELRRALPNSLDHDSCTQLTH
jgi:eukaryotic-like serine/threonine-protein kinase